MFCIVCTMNFDTLNWIRNRLTGLFCSLFNTSLKSQIYYILTLLRLILKPWKKYKFSPLIHSEIWTMHMFTRWWRHWRPRSSSPPTEPGTGQTDRWRYSSHTDRETRQPARRSARRGDPHGGFHLMSSAYRVYLQLCNTNIFNVKRVLNVDSFSLKYYLLCWTWNFKIVLKTPSLENWRS